MNNLKTLTLFLTTNCNLNCRYCFCGKKEAKTMDVNIAKKSVDFFKSHSDQNVNICFFGGEPLLEVDLIKELCAYIKTIYQGNASLSITTNGTLLTDEFVSLVHQYDISVQISIDGDEKTHDKNRPFYNGAGSWNCIMDNVKKYFARNSLMARITYGADDITNLFTNVRNLIEEGFNRLAFMPSFDYLWDETALNNFEKQYNLLCDYYYQTFIKNENIYFLEFDNIISGHIYNNIGGCCKPGISQISILPDGKIFPCNRVDFSNDTLQLGNIYDGFDEKKYDHFCNEVSTVDIDCSDCALLNRCPKCQIENFEISRCLWKTDAVKCYMNKVKILAVDKVASKLYNEKNESFMNRFYC